MTTTPKSERKHIVFIGKRNVGKSSLINSFSNQELSIVSNIPGTTTDPVKKSMELLPFGPVVLVDTAGVDDIGELGEKRINRTIKAISSADFVIFVLDSQNNLNQIEKEYLQYLDSINIPFICVINKIDLGINYELLKELKDNKRTTFKVSSNDKTNIFELKESIAKLLPQENSKVLVGDLIKQGDIILLVVPIDLGAPKGRLILPQVQTIRESLDEDAVAIVVKDTELRSTLNRLKEKPSLVVTDSQAIMRVSADVPKDVKLTTFSILMARYKGDLDVFVSGIKEIDKLENGDNVLIAEACTHHEQEDDIGRVKIPRWIKNYTKKNINFEVNSGHDFPENVGKYKFIVHCGGCMLTQRTMQTRIHQAKYLKKPIVNYGLLISYMHGAFPRVLEPFPEAMKIWESIEVIN